jgi:hypothetical protein
MHPHPSYEVPACSHCDLIQFRSSTGLCLAVTNPSMTSLLAFRYVRFSKPMPQNLQNLLRSASELRFEA